MGSYFVNKLLVHSNIRCLHLELLALRCLPKPVLLKCLPKLLLVDFGFFYFHLA